MSLANLIVIVATLAVLGLPTAAVAQDSGAPKSAPVLAKECIDAKLTTQADCDALLKKLGKLDKKSTDKTSTPTQQTAPVPPAVKLPQACQDAGVKTQQECDAFEAAQKAKSLAPGAGKPPAPQPTPPVQPQTASPVVPKSQGSQLPADCIAAGITDQRACDAFHARSKTLTTGQQTLSKTDVSKQPQSQTAPSTTAPTTKIPELAKDCVAAGLSTKADCDAFHAAQKLKQKPSPGPQSLLPATPQGSPLGGSTTGSSQPAGTSKVLAQDCVAAGLKTQADCDAFHALQKSKGASQPASKPVGSASSSVNAPASSQPASTPPAPTIALVSPDCIAAGAKTPAACDAYHLAQKGKAGVDNSRQVRTSTSQPKEVISTLPAGVTPQQVAPLLDSAKQPTPSTVQAAATPTAPPVDDKAAQATLKIATPPPLDTQAGKPISAAAKTAAVQLPSNVTIINQTVVNNITNNTTVINNAPGKGRPTASAPSNPIGLSIDIVLQVGNQSFVDSAGRDQYRIADRDRDRTEYEQLSGQRYRETISRPDGTRIVTVYDKDGDILRRSRFEPDGRETVLAYFDYSADRDLGQWRDPGEDLPPLQLQVPVQDYVLDADQANEAQIRTFFSQPPVEPLHRLYSISEVERSARLRDIVPRIELGDLTFDTGSADLGTDQIGALSSVANAMLALLQQNPAETFLIEGHTDAVGSDASNLVLSDNRAASVAQVLTEAYHIPPENLATQGYGDHFLKIQTDGPERLNRRVVIRRITPLITTASSP